MSRFAFNLDLPGLCIFQIIPSNFLCLQITYGSVAQTYCEKGTGNGLQARRRYLMVHLQIGTQDNQQIPVERNIACTFFPFISIDGMMHHVKVNTVMFVRCKSVQSKAFFCVGLTTIYIQL